jgi:hypothetical protein
MPTVRLPVRRRCPVVPACLPIPPSLHVGVLLHADVGLTVPAARDQARHPPLAQRRVHEPGTVERALPRPEGGRVLHQVVTAPGSRAGEQVTPPAEDEGQIERAPQVAVDDDGRPVRTDVDADTAEPGPRRWFSDEGAAPPAALGLAQRPRQPDRATTATQWSAGSSASLQPPFRIGSALRSMLESIAYSAIRAPRNGLSPIGNAGRSRKEQE